MSDHQGGAGMQRWRLELRGAVQGVGFRPFVYRLACAEGLGGFVHNTGEGAAVEVEGRSADVARFAERVRSELPSPAEIHSCRRIVLAPRGEERFLVIDSALQAAPSALLMPDLALCAECRREIFDPTDRRHGYPFTTCMHCGPRYSIVNALPYDRERTSMARFALCAACREEYSDPSSRRFHAETIACPDCGPQLALWDGDGAVLDTGDRALAAAAAALCRGGIVALKGLGGFQLLVDAADEAAVRRLRLRKRRPRKPFALMCETWQCAQQFAKVSEPERALLCSAEAPIVLLRRRGTAPAAAIAPGSATLGVMLPYTPLHALLLHRVARPLVATSGNRHGDPLVTDEREALRRLGGIADLWLVHDRPILRAVDDSVVRVMGGRAVLLRRARGYAPRPISHPAVDRTLLALGGQQKNAIATAFAGRIFLGPHVGDLASPLAQSACERTIAGLCALHGLVPERVASDLHPDYHTTHLARGESGAALPPTLQASWVGVPHHLAHVLAGMVDNDLSAPVLGVAWDGTGHDGDDTIRGGEFLLVGRNGYRRCAQLLPFALPGGEAAVREPRRAACGVLHALFGASALQRTALAPVGSFGAEARRVMGTMLSRGINAPPATSVGRLFDAVAALLDLCQRSTFEGEAAMAVESAADRARSPARLPPGVPVEREGRWIVDWRPTLTALIESVECRDGEGAVRPALVAALAAGFHDALARTIVAVAERCAEPRVLLTGGCFQNARLLLAAVRRLRAAGFTPYWHRRIPPNDGGLAVGQIAFAARPLPEEYDASAPPGGRTGGP